MPNPFSNLLEQPQPEQEGITDLTPPDPSMMGSPAIESMPTAVSDMVSTKDFLDEIEYNLRGYVLKLNLKTGVKGWESARDPLMNERGIAAYMSVLRNGVNKNSTMSVIPQWRIPIIVGELGVNLWTCISENKAVYDLSDEDYIEMKMRTISVLSTLEVTFRSATEGTTNRNVLTGQRSITMKTEQVNQPQPGLLARLNPFNKNG
jgi:hypothetical protein